MACGALLLGALTELLEPAFLWDEEVLLLLDRSSSPLRVEDDDPLEEPVEVELLWVCVVRPSPTAAPRALTTLSPARPA